MTPAPFSLHPFRAVAAALLLLTVFSCGPREASHGDFITVTQKDGPVLSYSPASGVTILKADGKAFKDLNRNGMLDPYEDWRLSPA